MAEMNHETKTSESRRQPGTRLVIPFFVVLGLLTVISFIIPLRPTVSYEEKRELAKFPEFSWETLVSGDYFDDITLWFSDTFPGRQRWVDVSDQMKSLYGYSDIVIGGSLEGAGDLIPVVGNDDETPSATEETVPVQTSGSELPADTTPATEPAETEPVPTEWGGVDAANKEDIYLGVAIQIGDSAFNQLGFSKYESGRYIEILSDFATRMKEKNVRVISCPAPTAVGILVERQYLEKLNCAPQDDMLEYLHSNMNEDVVTVDTFSRLIAHNSEYVYFRTDHHWTALGAYYGYQALCEDAGMETASLDSFEEWDMGYFPGGLYGKVGKPARLRADNLVAYVPPGDITMNVIREHKIEENVPILRDMSLEPDGAKYSTFLSGDHALAEIVNDSIPDAPNCVVIKDSFGSPFCIYLTQNYHKVYCIDYRKYKTMNLTKFVDEYDISDVIIAPYMIATQSLQGNNMLERLCG